MKYRSISSLLLFVGVWLLPGTARAELDVVTTIPDLAAIAREIGGSEVKVTSLSLHTQDPHFVDARPSLTLALSKADLLVAVGLELEVGWLPTLQTGGRNARVQRGGQGYLECAQFVELVDVPRGPVDRSMGDIHPGGNPHFLYDPRGARACARAMADKMAALDPGHAKAYRAGFEAFAKRLDERRADWEKRLAPYRGTPVITYHKSWIYLTRWLGLDEVATLEPKPGIAPSPRHVAQVIRLAQQKKVRILVQEAYYPSKTGELVAKKIGARLVNVPGGADVRSGQSYLDRMEQMVSLLEQGLKK